MAQLSPGCQWLGFRCCGSSVFRQPDCGHLQNCTRHDEAESDITKKIEPLFGSKRLLIMLRAYVHIVTSGRTRRGIT